jgi:peptidoglycan hydrolase-like amidase
VAVSSGKIRLSGNGIDETLSSVTFVRGKSRTLSDNLLTIGSYSYLGNIKFTVSGSSVRAINTIDLEQYLYGVVAAEMGNGFPLEALKAQAVCARCYAIRKIDSSDSSDTYDIVGTSSDQAYKGYNASYTRVIEAVDATKGQVLMNGKKIIDNVPESTVNAALTYYSADNEKTGIVDLILSHPVPAVFAAVVAAGLIVMAVKGILAERKKNPSPQKSPKPNAKKPRKPLKLPSQYAKSP